MISYNKIFKDINLQHRQLSECELVYKSEDNNSRLYIVKENDSFWAHAVTFASCPSEYEDADWWKSDELVVNTLFEVTAYFDGVRHLEFNRNGGEIDGYLYYPDMDQLIAMLQKIREIELEVCTGI